MPRRRCQLLLDHDLWNRLKADADRRQMSVSALVREKLNGLQVVEAQPRTAIGPPVQSSEPVLVPIPRQGPPPEDVSPTKPIPFFDF